MLRDSLTTAAPSTYPRLHSLHRFAHGRRLIRFSVVGGVGTAVNMVILYLLAHYGGWNHLAAAAVATEAAILSNFVMNDRWTFRDTQSRFAWTARVLRYNTISLAGAMISLGMLAALTMGTTMHYLFANLLGIAAGTFWNYALNSHLIWTITKFSAGEECATPNKQPGHQSPLAADSLTCSAYTADHRSADCA